MESKVKKVELIELFYDLIYVYAISRLTLLMEEPEGGIVTWEMATVFIIFFLVIVQTWFMMTRYVNHCCSWRWYDYVLLVTNMAFVVLMTQSISADPDTTSTALLISLTMMTVCIIALYLSYYLGDGEHKTFARHNILMLIPMVAVFSVILALDLTGFDRIARYIVAVNLLIGFVLPLTSRDDEGARCSHFPHLVERMELFTIIMFGEALVSITGFFSLTDPSPLGVMNFLIIFTMFGYYVCQVHLICDHHQVVRADRMVGCHYLIYLAISLITVAFTFIDGGEVDPMLSASLAAVSMLIFVFSVQATSGYNHPGFRVDRKDLAIRLLMVVVGAAVMFAFHGEPYSVSIGALIGFGLNLAFSRMRYCSATDPA